MKQKWGLADGEDAGGDAQTTPPPAGTTGARPPRPKSYAGGEGDAGSPGVRAARAASEPHPAPPTSGVMATSAPSGSQHEAAPPQQPGEAASHRRRQAWRRSTRQWCAGA